MAIVHRSSVEKYGDKNGPPQKRTLQITGNRIALSVDLSLKNKSRNSGYGKTIIFAGGTKNGK